MRVRVYEVPALSVPGRMTRFFFAMPVDVMLARLTDASEMLHSYRSMVPTSVPPVTVAVVDPSASATVAVSVVYMIIG